MITYNTLKNMYIEYLDFKPSKKPEVELHVFEIASSDKETPAYDNNRKDSRTYR